MSNPMAGTREELLGRTFVRLVGTSTLPEEAAGWFRYARPVCGDLVELFVFDSPESVYHLRDEDVERFGADDLRAAGVENLLLEPVDAVETLEGPGGVTLHVVLGESVFVASKLLVLPAILRQVYGERAYPDGVLVAPSIRHQLALFPVEGNILRATEVLAAFAFQSFADGDGPVTPFVYWWRGGDLTQVTYLDDEGALAVDSGGEFGDLLARSGADGT